MMTIPRWLVLFDVDGTLLVTGGAGSRAIKKAMSHLLGDHFAWHPITPGLLDPQIYAELAMKNGVAKPDERHDDYRRLYLEALREELGQAGDEARVLPGVRSLLDQLTARDDVVIGLLTGNYRRGVELKLAAAGLSMEIFTHNAFAEDASSRKGLVKFLLERWAAEHGEPIDPARVFVLGDTPRDVACAAASGCRSVAVATGWYTEQQLRDAGADLVLPDFSDPSPLLELLG